MIDTGHGAAIRVGTPLAVALACTIAATGCITRNPNLETGLRPTESGIGTAPMMPNFEPSDEATAEELERVREEGNAVGDELGWVRENDVAASGQMVVGEYVVTYLIGAPLGWYAPGADGRLAWTPPRGDAHVAVSIRDAADGRIVPGLTVHATLTPSGGGAGATTLPYGWYPVLNRYGDDMALPAGPFTLRIVIDPAPYWRHDPVNGDRFADTTIAEFRNVTVDRGALARLARIEGATDATRDSVRTYLAKREGRMLQRSLDEMFSSVAVNGAETRDGPYLVTLAVERAEAYWVLHGKDLSYNTRVEQSAERNAHLEVGVRDTVTGRFVPGLDVTATVTDASNHVVGTMPEMFMWHPWIHHYGQNWRVPRTGRYTIRAHAAMPPFRRYGRSGATLFAAPVDAQIARLRFVTGQK